MRSERKIFERLLAGVISASLILPMSGCTDKVREEPPSAVAEATPTQAAVQAESTPEPAPAKIDDNGTPIADFDEFVNGEWLSKQEADGSKTTAASWETGELIEERVKDILENTDISGMSEGDSLAKVITFYDEALDTEDMEGRMKYIRDYLAPIANAKSVDDLYELSAKEEYSIFDTVIRFEVQSDGYGSNTETYAPYRDTKLVEDTLDIITGDEKPEEKEAFLAYWKELGVSEERFKEILGNALKVAQRLDEFYAGADYENDLYFIDEDSAKRKGLNVPVIDILRELNGYGRYEEFLAPTPAVDMLNSLYTAENVNVLRDNYLYVAGMDLYESSGYRAQMAGTEEEREEYERMLRQTLCDYAGDVLAEEYRNRYQEDGMYENAEILADEIKNELMAFLSDADWMGENSRRALKAKIARMSYFLGSNGYVNELADLDLSGNYMEDYIGFKMDRKRFMRSMAKYENDKRQPFQAEMLIDNGQYFRKNNMFVLCTGTLVSDNMKNDAAYEERLATAGSTMAHEMSHTLTPDAVYCDEHGDYNYELLNEQEMEELWNRAEAIADFFDGMEIADGKSLNGWRVENETFADLLGLRVCLNLLAKQKDPDYDLFFRTWAEDRALYLAEEDFDKMLDDPHLPGKQRINYVLGQFDIFYEIYDIDENSPYYVPEEKRLKTY
ncbi:MAG: hypothetical protein J6X66_05420 [Lachnospiraceae bacterium]|nr:hypothetical protein [Lachnospiraceae bacterium]